MTIKSLKEKYKGQVAASEIYRFRDDLHEIYADNITALNDVDENEEVCQYKVMNEAEYNKSVYAHSVYTANFEDYYDSKDAKVLIIVLHEE